MTTTTWSTTDKDADWALSGGDLTAVLHAPGGSAVQGGARGTVYKRLMTGLSTGKYYFELTVTNQDDTWVGLADRYIDLSSYGGSFTNNIWVYSKDGYFRNNTQSPGYDGTGWSSGTHVVMVAIDTATKKAWFGLDGTWQNSGDPAAGTGQIWSNLADPILPYINGRSFNNSYTNTCVANFGGSAFSYTPPTGFNSWDTDQPDLDYFAWWAIPKSRVRLHNRYEL